MGANGSVVIARVCGADQNEVWLACGDGLDGIEYLHSAFVVDLGETFESTLAAGTRSKNNDVLPGEGLRELRDGVVLERENERLDRGRDSLEIRNMVLCADDRGYRVLVTVRK